MNGTTTVVAAPADTVAVPTSEVVTTTTPIVTAEIIQLQPDWTIDAFKTTDTTDIVNTIM